MPINVTPLFDFDKVSYEKENEVHLDVVFKAPERDSTKRIPLHLVLAIDCSGSMAGDKLSQVKSTVSKLVDHLTENDSIAITAFSQDAWEVTKSLPMTAANKTFVKNRVTQLHTFGSTNLSEAITFAMERAVSVDKTKTCRIVLLTDGCPTCGTCDREGLLKIVGNVNPAVSISTFGYGSDFDSDLMASLSDKGRGNNFFIKEDKDCNSAFALELGGLLSLYGQNLKITLVPSPTMNFTELLSEYKCEQKHGYRLITPSKFEVTIDDIFAGETKHLIMKLTVPKATAAVSARSTKVCDISVVYTDAETKQETNVSGVAKINYVKSDKIATTANQVVREQLAIIETIKIQKAAKEEADKQNYEGARLILQEGISWAHANSNVLQNSEAIAVNYTEMMDNYNSSSYATTGTKLNNSFYITMTRGRAATAGDYAQGMVFSNGVMTDMVASFAGDANPVPSLDLSSQSIPLDLSKIPENEVKVKKPGKKKK
jgi:uncharacterized protein YegL